MSESKGYLEEKQVNAPGTIGEGGKRLWIYPDRRKGPRATKRGLLALFLFAFYIFAPWLEIAGRPLIRIDILEQKAFLFGLVLQMNEYSYIFFVLLALALGLFLITTLRGRIWCGYACPQTVFVEWIIRPIEEFLEGPAIKRFKNDRSKITPQLAFRKTLKHICFFAVALLAANLFLGFFVDPKLVLSWVINPPSNHPTAFGLVMGMTALMYFDLAWFREQFCSFICPYARFQSALLDNHSPSVVYDFKRGEPRGKGKKDDIGDCIDCGLCHRVCPTGIDIRNGLQLECIQCERCVDACESVMINLKRPVGLIRITPPHTIEGEKQLPFWRRVRVWVYSLLIVAVAGSGSLKVVSRDPVSLTILRTPGAAYANMPDGRHSNMFQVRFLNNTGQKQAMVILQESKDKNAFEIICPGCGQEIAPYSEVSAPMIVIFDKKETQKSLEIKAGPGDDFQSYLVPIIH